MVKNKSILPDKIKEQIVEHLIQRYDEIEEKVEEINAQIEELELKKKKLREI